MEKFSWVTDDIRTFLERGYFSDVSLEERYMQIATYLEELSGIDGFADTVYDYCRKNWLSFASPILSNFGTDKGLPISCNFGVVNDTLESILFGKADMGIMAKHGAGTAKHMSNIRAYGVPYGKDKSGRSEGMISWIAEYASTIGKVNQGGLRRGYLTVYSSIEHDEIDSFLNIGMEGDAKKDPAFGIRNITTAVTIPKGYLDDVKAGNKKKRAIYAKLLKRRAEKGFPYILFEDNCNDQKPQVYIDKNMDIITSNICTEVIEYCDEEKEFACCLSSANAAKADEWIGTDFIYNLAIILDCVNENYIALASGIRGFEKAVKFMREHRAIGVGVLGFHSYLQQKMIPFGSLQSYQFNNRLFSYIQQETERASRWMAETWGEPKMLEGYGFRNTTRMAIAPTKSSSFIMGGYSLGIEPIKSNYHEKRLAKIQTTYKNPELINCLARHGKDDRDTWKSILENNGSVQHLDFLSELERDVFKTFSEISQVDIIKLAGQRQKFIDQGQSVNLMIHPDTKPKDVSKLIFLAHAEGLKTLYYQYTVNAAQKFNQDLLTCSSCEG